MSLFPSLSRPLCPQDILRSLRIDWPRTRRDEKELRFSYQIDLIAAPCTATHSTEANLVDKEEERGRNEQQTFKYITSLSSSCRLGEEPLVQCICPSNFPFSTPTSECHFIRFANDEHTHLIDGIRRRRDNGPFLMRWSSAVVVADKLIWAGLDLVNF